MEKKHIGKIVALMVLMFISSFGSNIEAFLQANVEYDYASGYAFLYTILGFCCSAFIAMIIPLVCRLVKGRKLSHKWGKLLCVVNSIIALIISSILLEYVGILFLGVPSAIFYYFINKWLFVAGKEEQATEEQPDIQQMNLSFPDEKPTKHSGYAVLFDDVKLEQDAPHVQSDKSINPTPFIPASTATASSANENVRYCSLCRGYVDEYTNKCTVCGKQYFKRISWPVIVLFIIVIALVVALVFAITKSNDPNSSQNGTASTASSTPKSTTSPPEPYYQKLGLTLNEYNLAKIVSYDVYRYCDYMAELKEIVRKGTYSNELKQERVIDSLNNNDYFEYGEKIILYRLLFPYDNEYNKDIVDYLNERDDVSYTEMEFVLVELGFAVFEDGSIKWD